MFILDIMFLAFLFALPFGAVLAISLMVSNLASKRLARQRRQFPTYPPPTYPPEVRYPTHGHDDASGG